MLFFTVAEDLFSPVAVSGRFILLNVKKIDCVRMKRNKIVLNGIFDLDRQ